MRSQPALCLLAGLCFASSTPGQATDLYDDTVLQVFELTFQPADWFNQLSRNQPTRTPLKADLKIGGTVYHDVGVTLRGKSSLSLPQLGGSRKLPFRIEMDAFVPGQKLQRYATIKLNNGFLDPTFVREVLTSRIYRRYTAAPRANYARLVINSQSFGLYINVEAVNKQVMRSRFGTDDGHRYEAVQVGGLEYFGTSLGEYQKRYALRSKPDAASWQDLIELCRRVSTLPAASVEKELPKLLDVDNYLRHLATMLVVGHEDSGFWRDYYLYHDTRHGLFQTVPWDFNLCWSKWDVKDLTLRSLAQKQKDLLQIAPFRKRYLAHLRHIANESIDWSRITPQVQRLQAFIDSEVKADPNKFYSYSDFKNNVTQTVTGRIGQFQLPAVPALKSFVDAVLPGLRAFPEFAASAPLLSQPTRTPVAPKDADRIWFTVRISGAASGVSLWYRARGAWLATAMFDDGKHRDGGMGDGVWGIDLPPQVAGTVITYYFAVDGTTASGGAMRFLPATAGHEPWSFRVAPRRDGVLLHELLASNRNGIQDEKGEREDWLELYNPTQASVDVGGMYLTDDAWQPTKWQLPANTSIGAGRTLLVWADDEVADGLLHASFKLNATEGEEVALFAKDGLTMLDYFRFGPQAPDTSVGRIEDRLSQWVTYPDPTPGAANAPKTCGSRRWSALASAGHVIVLQASGTPKLATVVNLDLGRGPANSAFVLLLAADPGDVPLPGLGISILFSSPILAVATVPSDARGAARLPVAIPNLPGLAGQRLAFEALALAPSGWTASNGVELRFCR